MPIYEYRCRACGAIFERFAQTGEERTEGRECPRCGGTESDRVFSTLGSCGRDGNGSSCTTRFRGFS